MRRLVPLLALVVLATACGSAAQARGPLVFGVADDTLKWTDDPSTFLTEAADLGVGALRVTTPWRGLQTSAVGAAVLARLDAPAAQTRVVAAIGGGRRSTRPRTRRPRRSSRSAPC